MRRRVGSTPMRWGLSAFWGGWLMRWLLVLLLALCFLAGAAGARASAPAVTESGQGCGLEFLAWYDCLISSVPETEWDLSGPYTIDQAGVGPAAQCVFWQNPLTGTRCASGAVASQTNTTTGVMDARPDLYGYGRICFGFNRFDQTSRVLIVAVSPSDGGGQRMYVSAGYQNQVCTVNRAWSSGVAVTLTITVSNDGLGAAPARFQMGGPQFYASPPPATDTATATGTAVGTATNTATGVPTRNCGVVDDCDLVFGESGPWQPVSGYGPGSCISHVSPPFTVHCDGPDAFWQNFTAPLTGQICVTGEGTAGLPITVRFFTGPTSDGRSGTQVGADFSIGGLGNPPQCVAGFVAGSVYYMEVLPRDGGAGATNLYIASVVASVVGTATPTNTATATAGSATATGTVTPTGTVPPAYTAMPSSTATLIPRPTSTITGTGTIDCGLLCDCMILSAQIIAGGEQGIADATTGVAHAGEDIAAQQQRIANYASGWAGAITTAGGAVAQGGRDASAIGGAYILTGTANLSSAIDGAAGGLPIIGASVITGSSTLAASLDDGFGLLGSGVAAAGGAVGASVLTATSQINTGLAADWASSTAAITGTGANLALAVRGAGDVVAAGVISSTLPLAGISASLDGVTVAVAGLVTVTQHLSDKVDLAGPWLDTHLIGDTSTGINGLGNSTHDIADQIQSAFMVGDCSSLVPTCVSELSAFNTELVAGGAVVVGDVAAVEAAVGAEVVAVDGAVVAGNTEAVAAAGVVGVDLGALAAAGSRFAGLVPCGTTVGPLSVDGNVCWTGDVLQQMESDLTHMPDGVVANVVPQNPAADIAPIATAVHTDLPNFHSIDGSVSAAPCATVTIYGGHIDLCHGYYEDHLREPVYDFQLAMLGLGVAFLVVAKFRRAVRKGEVG